MTKELSKEELMAMPLVALRGIDVDTPQQQELLQEIVNIKLAGMPVQRPVYRKDVPDIQTPQEEAKWQEIMRQREAKIRNQDVPAPEVPAEVPTAPVEAPVVVPPTAPVEPAPAAPAAPVQAPTTPDESGMAQATGEGEPVTMAIGVSPRLTKSGKPDRRIKVK
jgi:hypothetical protein